MPSRRSFLQFAGLAGLTLYSRPRLFADPEMPATLDEFGYGDVELAPGLAQSQLEHTQSVLLSLNEDSLLKPWRLRAGLPAPGPDLGGWYDEVVPQVETASGGHGFAPGHCFGQWISSLCRGYAINHDPRTRAKVVQLLDLYSPTISGEFYRNFRYPAYNYDKMVLGLIDAHRYANIPQAYDLLNRTTAAAVPYLPPRALDRGEPQSRWRVSVGDTATKDYTRDESYTLPENLYIATQSGAGEHYRELAQRFLLDQTFFDPLSENKNVLPDHHAYSYFNSLNSAMMAYMATGSQKHFRAAKNGFDMVLADQSFATGGWGPNESFYEPGSDILYKSLTSTHRCFETPCGSFAHLKLTRYLLRATRDGRYGDSMERVMYNTVLGAKHLEPDGHAFYYSDYNMQGRRTYFPDAWPCCSGTLPQVAADYRILSYFHDRDGIYVNLYVPSTVKWVSQDGAQLALTQTGTYPLEGEIAMRLKVSRPSDFALSLRIPAWSNSAQDVVLRVNGLPIPVSEQSGFTTIQRTWKDGDRVELSLALPMRLEPIDPQHPEMVALIRGPLVLFAITENAPYLLRKQFLDAQRTPDKAEWRVQTKDGVLRLVPFTEIGEDPYAAYLHVS
jgi:uncharacterized protein